MKTKKFICLVLTFAIISMFISNMVYARTAADISDTITENSSNLPWRLYSDGTLVVEEGFINWDCNNVRFSEGPWEEYREYIYRIIFTGPVIGGESLRGLFTYLRNLTVIEGLDYFDTSNVVNMRDVFADASGLTSLNLSSWDTSNVTDMSGMFEGNHSLMNLDISSFDTRNVTSMSSMFGGARRLTNLDLSSFDTRNVIDMQLMFYLATGITNLNLSNWDVSNVTLMHSMFRGASSLRQLTLCEHIRFIILDNALGGPALPPAPNNDEFTGYWQNVGDGTVDNPQGEFVFRSDELMRYYDGAIHADTWVWQPRNDESPPELSVPAEPTAATVLVNGENVSFQAYHIGGRNFFRLRDIAYVLNGTSAQFNVGWDNENNAILLTTNQAYEIIGGEMVNTSDGVTIASSTAATIFLNGEEISFTAYHIGGNNYFMLRHLGYALGFIVDWDEETGTILIITN
ncbi:MAG: BspA family leucine-rich repeat surface protein [Oscillospiraceae bacterium]|nr:BspA family leucine-rich repeat surface protein [Oscillospiraceae bacterium]